MSEFEILALITFVAGALNQLRNDLLASDPIATKRPLAPRRETDSKVRLRPIAKMLLETLVARVAEALYHDELRAGAWAVDVGLVGCGLFAPEARRVPASGDGELWEID